MLPENRITTYPGQVLLLDFLEPIEVSQSEFARHLGGGPVQRTNELVKGKRGITPETAWLLSKSLGTTPEFWMNLQVVYELSSTQPPRGIKRLVARMIKELYDRSCVVNITIGCRRTI